MKNYNLRIFSIKLIQAILWGNLIFFMPLIGLTQVVINQVDDFNDGGLAGWVRGQANDTIITNQNNKLQVRAVGGSGAFGKLLIFNETTWSGDYIGQGITSIKLKLHNNFDPFGNGLRMRLAIGDNRTPGPTSAPSGTWFVSTTPIIINTSSGEIEAVFSLKEADMTRAQGTASFANVLANVAALRITNSTSIFNPRGDDNTIANLLIDDITACGCIGTPYNETTAGDLSNDFSKPTFITLSGSMDTITSCQQGNPADVDYFTIEVPQDSVLSGLVLTNYEAELNNNGFIGVQAGNVFTTTATTTTAGDLLGGLTYGETEEGADILATMGTLSDSQGFTGSLLAGKYTFWLNQTGNQSCASFQFQLSKAPVNTDLSNDRLNPTVIQFSSGMDTVSNCIDNNDVDYFTFEVPVDSVLTGITLTNYEVDTASNLAFLGIQKGETFTEPVSNTNVANLLGGLIFGVNNIGTDLLPTMGNLNGSQGFTTPLPTGSYTIWLNQTGDQSCAAFQFIFADKDLSDDRLNPTVITLSGSLDTVSNCVQGDPMRDIDYFTFTVPTNSVLSEFKLKNYEFEGANNQAFIGIQAGTIFTEPTAGTNVANLLGGLIFGENNEGTDILPAMGALGSSQGFTAPLPSGDYTIWLNQTGPLSCATFEFDLTISNACSNSLTFTNETVIAATHKAADTIETIGNVLIRCW